MGSIPFVERQILPGNLGCESAPDQESQAQHAPLKRQDDITVFKPTLGHLDGAFFQEGLELLLCELSGRLCRPASENLDESCRGLDVGSHFLKSLQSHHAYLQGPGDGDGRALFEEPPALLMPEKKAVVEISGGDAEAFLHEGDEKSPLTLFCQFWP